MRRQYSYGVNPDQPAQQGERRRLLKTLVLTEAIGTCPSWISFIATLKLDGARTCRTEDG
jgi:hypothetical protein